MRSVEDYINSLHTTPHSYKKYMVYFGQIVVKIDWPCKMLKKEMEINSGLL